MPSPIVNATISAAVLSGLSNLVAQLITAYRTGEQPFVLQVVPLFQFILFALISCPPNFMWQMFLEDQFPGKKRARNGTQELDTVNTAKKFALDQSIGAIFNTVAFIAAMSAFKGNGLEGISRDVSRDWYTLMSSGWKLWPAVSLINLTLTPVHLRVPVGSLVGFFWGIYLSLMTAN